MAIEHIRVGSYTKNLYDFPEKERALWRFFDRVPFEEGIAVKGVSPDDVLNLIDYPAYFGLMDQQLPDNRQGILQPLISEGIIRSHRNDLYEITNVGTILFARNLEDFRRLARKTIRVIVYKRG